MLMVKVYDKDSKDIVAYFNNIHDADEFLQDNPDYQADVNPVEVKEVGK